MVGFDAERYLRMLGERQLLDAELRRGHRDSPLEAPATALVAAGSISPVAAQRVIEDYALVMSARSGHHGAGHFHAPARRRRTVTITQPWTAILDTEVEIESGRLLVRDLSMTESEGTLRFRWQRDARSSGTGRMAGRPGGFPWGSAAPVIVDEAGNRPVVRAGGGGGSDDHWDGKLQLTGAISPRTAWLEVNGTRVTLDTRTAAYEVSIEPLAAETTVQRQLWRRLSVGQGPFGRTSDLEPAIDALLAAGAVDAGDPVLGELRAVAAQLPDHPRRGTPAPAGGGRGLPEPWRSLLRRYRHDDGPSRTLVVGALTPIFDAIRIAVHSVTSQQDAFEMEFTAVPGVLLGQGLDELPVAWWARDDRGNHYLGSPSGWSGSNDQVDGTVRYWPALDPRATRLDIMPTADTHRAVISISLIESGEREP